MAADPLDETRPDPRDRVQPPPARFPGVFGSVRRSPDPIGDGVSFARIYWVYGGNTSLPSEVSDPPSSGWSSCFVVEEGDRLRLFCPYSVQSWSVSKRSYEASSLQGAGEDFDWRARGRFQESLPRQYAAHKLRGWTTSDFATLERVMRAVGAVIPAEERWATLAPAARASERAASSGDAQQKAPQQPKTHKASAFKPVKRTGRKGEVLAYFVDKGLTASRSEAMAKFGITSSNLLSQLFLLRKDHGIEYATAGDSLTLTLPEGVTDPFTDA